MKQVYLEIKGAVKWAASAFSESNGKASFGRLACGYVIFHMIALGRLSLVIPETWWMMFTWLMGYCFGSKMTPAIADHFKTKLTNASNGNGKGTEVTKGTEGTSAVTGNGTAAVAVPAAGG
jgi:hypothetical protein